MTNLRLERRGQADETFRVGNVLLTPPVSEDYWAYRVTVADGQAVLAFPKFSTLGVGFAVEEDWNTNLPYDSLPERICTHIWHNRGPADGIDPHEIVHAIELIQWAAFTDRDRFREPYVHGRTIKGALASQNIDLEEADGLPAGDGRDLLLASAERWRRQAARQQEGIDRSESIHNLRTMKQLVDDHGPRSCAECPVDIDGYPADATICVACEWYARQADAVTEP